jgi:hypothetical protein
VPSSPRHERSPAPAGFAHPEDGYLGLVLTAHEGSLLVLPPAG